MKTAAVFLLGAGIIYAAHHWHRPIAWMLTRNLPPTPTGWVPRTRTWHHGIEVTP